MRMDCGTNNPIDAVGGGRFEEERSARPSGCCVSCSAFAPVAAVWCWSHSVTASLSATVASRKPNSSRISARCRSILRPDRVNLRSAGLASRSSAMISLTNARSISVGRRGKRPRSRKNARRTAKLSRLSGQALPLDSRTHAQFSAKFWTNCAAPTDLAAGDTTVGSTPNRRASSSRKRETGRGWIRAPLVLHNSRIVKQEKPLTASSLFLICSRILRRRYDAFPERLPIWRPQLPTPFRSLRGHT